MRFTPVRAGRPVPGGRGCGPLWVHPRVRGAAAVELGAVVSLAPPAGLLVRRTGVALASRREDVVQVEFKASEERRA